MPAAIEASTANAAVNGIELQLHRMNLRESLPQLAPTVVANMTSPILKAVAGHLDSAEPRVLVLSGILPAELDEVVAAFARSGFVEDDRRQIGDWAALLLRRPL
jgi:ribosomal protein L11 methylase PrmA